MIVSLDGKSKRVRQWYKNHVYYMFRFRKSLEHNYNSQETRHLENKVNQHMNSGKRLGLSPDEMRSFNLAIIKEMGSSKDFQRKDPQAIIKTLIRENGQK